MFNLKAFKTDTGYQVTNGPIVIDLDADLAIVQSNTDDAVVKDHARGLAKALTTRPSI